MGWVVGTHSNNFAAPYEALILHTNNGGRNWKRQVVDIPPQQSITFASLSSINFCNGSIGWAVGGNMIVHTVDGGQTWETQRSGGDENLASVFCLNSEYAWAVGQDGTILRTADGGESWSRQVSGVKSFLLGVRFFENSGWIIGREGTLLRTRDGGENWERQRLDISETLRDIYINGVQGWIVGTRGTILHTEDGGQTWQQQKSPTDNDLVSLSFISPKQGWAGGDKRTLLRFSD